MNVDVGRRSSKPRPRRTQEERTAATRSALVRAARGLFAGKGFTDTSLEEIVSGAGVTRGALYHHFDSKADLFAAVVVSIDAEIADRAVEASRRARSATTMIVRAADAYLELAGRPEYARILADVPSVLGDRSYSDISSDHCLDLLRAAIEWAASEGSSLRSDPSILAAMLLGALNEAVMVRARSFGSTEVAAATSRAVEEFLRKLLA